MRGPRRGAAAPRREGDRRTGAAPAPGLAARRGAVSLLSAVLDHGRMLEEAGLPGGLAPPERAEAQRLADLALRRLGQVDDILSRFAERKPPAPASHILRIMTAAMVFAGTAPHAAVDLAVRHAKSDKRGAKLAGLVNAVGRKVAAQGAAIAADQEPVELNTPDWLARALIADWGEDAEAIARAHLAQPCPDLTPAQPEKAAGWATRLGGRLLPTGTIRLEHRPQISALPGYAEGAWWAQDAAAALPARLIPAPKGRRVLDLCAAPGGKTMQLAAAGARVTALDISGRRLERLAENLARTGLQAEIVVADALEWAPEAPFDAILLDAPCSATGTIRRHPDLPRRGAPPLAELTALQDRLLARAWDWLAPGGVLVYAACSLLRAEGEERLDAFLAAHPEARLHPVRELPPELVDARGCLRSRPDLWPDDGGLDGFFAARLVREG